MEEARGGGIGCRGVCGDPGLPSTAQAYWSETSGGRSRGWSRGVGQVSRG